MNRRDDRLENLKEQRRSLKHFLAAPELLNAETLDSFKKRLSFIEEEIRNTDGALWIWHPKPRS